MPAQAALIFMVIFFFIQVILWDLQDFLLFQKELSSNNFPLLSINSVLVSCVFWLHLFIYILIFSPPLVFKPKMLVTLRLGISVQALLSSHGQPIASFLTINCLSSMRCLIRGEEILVQTSCFARKSHQHLFECL